MWAGARWTVTPSGSPSEAVSEHAASEILSEECSASLESPSPELVQSLSEDAKDSTSEDRSVRASPSDAKVSVSDESDAEPSAIAVRAAAAARGFGGGTGFIMYTFSSQHDGVCSESCMSILNTLQSRWSSHAGNRSCNGTSSFAGEGLAKGNMNPVPFAARCNSNPQCWLAAEISKSTTFRGVMPLFSSAADNLSQMV